MKKRGVSKPVLISAVALLITLTAFLYLYTGEEVELTPEEQKTAGRLELTPKEFKEVSMKAYGALIKDKPFYEEFESPPIGYYEVDKSRIEDYHSLKDLKLKPGSKIIRAELVASILSPYIIYLVEDSKVKVLVEELYLMGELAWKNLGKNVKKIVL